MDLRQSPYRTGSDPSAPNRRPGPPAARWMRSLVRFDLNEAASGAVLLLCAVAALALANSPWSAANASFWQTLFIAGLALDDGSLLDAGKIGSLAGSVPSAFVGSVLLLGFLPHRSAASEEVEPNQLPE